MRDLVWFKVDDNFADHPKVRAIPRTQRGPAIGLWTLAGSWCARQLMDGRVPGYMLDELASKPSSAAALVAVDLWHTSGHSCGECPAVADGAFLFHDWPSCQPTRAEVEAERAASRERQRKAREKAKSQRESQRDNGVTSSVSHSVTAADVQLPRTRPVPVPVLTTTSKGDRYEPFGAANGTSPPICTTHPEGDSGTACGGCAKVRQWWDAFDANEEDLARRYGDHYRSARVRDEIASAKAAAVPRPRGNA